MKLYLYQIDAFTEKVFSGNPACIVPLHKWLEDEILLKIAQENAVSETAFFVQNDHFFRLRGATFVRIFNLDKIYKPNNPSK